MSARTDHLANGVTVMTVEALPFWLTNVPKDEWPAECPDYLAKVGASDRKVLGTRDEDYRFHTWQEVTTIISKAPKSTI
jgi:hypothetical protein